MRPNINAQHYRNRFENLNGEEHIYKYISLERISTIVRERSMRFYSVNSWEDVYENYFLKQNFITADGYRVDAEAVSNGIYGQSWTLQEESDAMWRIYSQQKDAVKVRTTAEKLMDVLYIEDRCMADTCIARVDYLTRDDIENEYRSLSENRISIGKIQEFILKSLKTKRTEFVHEEEVRITKMLSTEDGPICEYIEMPINPDELFEEFVIDPRVSEQEEHNICNILTTAGVAQNKIKKSNLYELNRFTLIV